MILLVIFYVLVVCVGLVWVADTLEKNEDPGAHEAVISLLGAFALIFGGFALEAMYNTNPPQFVPIIVRVPVVLEAP